MENLNEKKRHEPLAPNPLQPNGCSGLGFSIPLFFLVHNKRKETTVLVQLEEVRCRINSLNRHGTLCELPDIWKKFQHGYPYSPDNAWEMINFIYRYDWSEKDYSTRMIGFKKTARNEIRLEFEVSRPPGPHGAAMDYFVYCVLCRVPMSFKTFTMKDIYAPIRARYFSVLGFIKQIEMGARLKIKTGMDVVDLIERN